MPFPSSSPASIKGWEEYLKEGKQFLKAASNGFDTRKEVFTAEILYNMIAMSIEKFIMGALMASGNLPYNHTMYDLVEAMESHLPGALEGIKAKLLALDAFQDICDLENYKIAPPMMEEIPAILDLAHELQNRTCIH